MASARQWLENRGWRVIVLAETATELISAGFSPFEEWNDSLAFQRHIILHSIARENLYYRMNTARPQNTRGTVMLCDRGILDSIAYVGMDSFEQILEELEISIHDLRNRYRGAIHLVTAADGAEEHYTLENNSARSESPELARVLDIKTRAAWLGHHHFSIINNSTGFDHKITRAIRAMSRVLSMEEEPMEVERKFVWKNFNIDLIPADAVKIDIVQDYLKERDGKERRVRARTIDGATSYYYTEKWPADTAGKRFEKEKHITRRQYGALLNSDKDRSAQTIKKTRYAFTTAERRQFEVDVYSSPVDDLVVIEVELNDIAESVTFPLDWDVTEVTEDRNYSNHAIACGSLVIS
jgi:CYTH domain-containing protein